MAKKINYAALYTRRPTGLYQGYYRDANGKRHAVYDRDPEVLHRKIEELETPSPLTFIEIAKAWKDWKWDRIRDGTKSCYEAAYTRAVIRFPFRVASEIQPHEISNHLQQLQEQDYSAKVIKTQRLVYRAIYRHAIVDPEMGREIRTNPAAEVPLPAAMKKPKVREAPEDDVVKTIRESADDYWGLFPLLLVSTGMRRGEALALTWEDIDFKKKEIHISRQASYAGGIPHIADTKTEAGVRTVPILPDLEAALVMPKDARKTDYLFHGEDPTKLLNESTYRRRWMHYCKEHGFVTGPEDRLNNKWKTVHHYKPTLTAHVLRHGYATMLFEAGVDEYTAKRLLGHANVEITRAVYTHLRQKKMDESLKKLEEHVKEQMKNGR